MLSRKDWHSAAIGAVLCPVPGAKGAQGILPRRLVGRSGASVVVRRNAAINRMEDSDATICKEAFV